MIVISWKFYCPNFSKKWTDKSGIYLYFGFLFRLPTQQHFQEKGRRMKGYVGSPKPHEDFLNQYCKCNLLKRTRANILSTLIKFLPSNPILQKVVFRSIGSEMSLNNSSRVSNSSFTYNFHWVMSKISPYYDTRCLIQLVMNSNLFVEYNSTIKRIFWHERYFGTKILKIIWNSFNKIFGLFCNIFL